MLLASIVDVLIVGRYRLRDRLGAGMNEVWLAWDERERRDVALKVLRTTTAPEVALVEEVGSTRTARVLDHGAIEGGCAYLAMEYLRGLDLDALVRTYGQLDLVRALHVVGQACHAVADAHRAGVIHRDVKPGNLHCSDRDGEADTVRILDFGVARRIGSLDGVVVGTPAFMAPEAFDGAAPAPASDVYALGCTLYFALTGTPPFGDGDADALREAHRARCVDRLDVPRRVERVVQRAMAKCPGDRYADAAAMAAALDAATGEHEPWTADDAARWWQRARTGRLPTPLPSHERTTQVGVAR